MMMTTRGESTEGANETSPRQRRVRGDAPAHVDLMTDDELAAARVAPLVPPDDDDTQRRIVERVRVALSDERQGERACAIVLKRESSVGRVCEQCLIE